MITLIIMDGWGLSKTIKGNAIEAAHTPNIDCFRANCPSTSLHASGLAVGLPEGTQGNSEVGHMTIGAGRIAYQDFTLISKSINDGDFFENSTLLDAIKNCKNNDSALHLMGMISDEGVHSHISHLYALLELAKRHGLRKVYVHAFLDGRDVPPQSAKGYVQDLLDKFTEIGVGKLATICGRNFSMDRDQSWFKTEAAYDLMVNSKGDFCENPFKTIDDAYADGVKIDEHVKPTVLTENGEPIARIQDGDSVIHFNFRKDRGRQLAAALYAKDFSGFDRTPPSTYFVTMTEFDKTIGANVAFGQQVFSNHLGEWLSKNGLKNLRVAETEKYAHITFYLNALCDVQYEGEDRILIDSPKVKANFDEKPEMSAFSVKDAALESIRSQKYDAIMINFANCDLVGHSGVFEAAAKAAEVVDTCVGEVVDATLEAGGIAVVTADHGNAEWMTDSETGEMVTSHTTSPVPFFVIGKDGMELRTDGGLSDIAPTVLDLMGIEKPNEMTGESLVIRRDIK